jgi:group II intron reverse transcriptase/maturase
MPGEALTSLSHNIDIEWLKEAFRRTRKDGAVGVDGQTAAEYEAQLESNLSTLLDRAKRGTYRAPPVRRAHVPKGKGSETRPIGIPTFEDKLLQRAVVMALEPVYEQDFLICSYGFRPGRGQHDALGDLWKQAMAMRGGWVVEVDIRKFFDTLDRRRLQEIVRQRVRDGVLLRLIGKWLNAGVMEEGVMRYPDAGTPQGGVISPLLANTYLHEVVDQWFEGVVKPRLRGRAFMIRFADDMVLCFENEADAHAVLRALPKRFAKYGLTLHPEKTRLVRFDSPNAKGGEPGTFDFLGFTHHWGRTRRGLWAIKRRTAADRFTRAVRRVADWCRRNRHESLREKQRQLNRKLRGHYGYYGITGNSKALDRFRKVVAYVWGKWLGRRSQRSIGLQRFFTVLLPKYQLLPARPVHSMLSGLEAKP